MVPLKNYCQNNDINWANNKNNSINITWARVNQN